MALRKDIHAFFANMDPRILPYAYYQSEDDQRPLFPATAIVYRLAKGLDVDDSADNGPGRLGGDNGNGVKLPPVAYGVSLPLIDLSVGKLQGASPAPVDSDEDSCPTDSSGDQPGSDAHKLTQIAQAIHKQEPVTFCLKGHFRGDKNEEAVYHFQRDHVGRPPATLQELFHSAFDEIKVLAVTFLSSGIQG
jgi:hypothetical protein